jgi:hypothetical protein
MAIGPLTGRADEATRHAPSVRLAMLRCRQRVVQLRHLARAANRQSKRVRAAKDACLEKNLLEANVTRTRTKVSREDGSRLECRRRIGNHVFGGRPSLALEQLRFDFRFAGEPALPNQVTTLGFPVG